QRDVGMKVPFPRRQGGLDQSRLQLSVKCEQSARGLIAVKHDASVSRPSKERNRIEPGGKRAEFDRGRGIHCRIDIALENLVSSHRAKRNVEPVGPIDTSSEP